TLEEQGN
ncbi:unnamed protein product, partial [Allacma fusca]